MEVDYRFQHRHILGKSEDDTTELTKQLFLEDRGRLIIDPVGDISVELLELIDEKDIVYFNASDLEFPIPINPLWRVPEDMKPDVTDTLKEMFLNLWQYDDFPATRVITCLHNTIAALLDYPQGTLVGIKLMLISTQYRSKVIPYIKNPVIRSYWEDEFCKMPQKELEALVDATRANIHQLIADPRILNMIGTPKPHLNFKDIIKKKKTVIVNLSGLSRSKKKLLGSLILSMANAAAGEKDYHLYVLKAGLFTDSVLMDIIDSRKRLSLTIVHRYLGELSQRLQDAVLGSVGTQIFFSIGAKDAPLFEDQWEHSLGRASLSFELQPHQYRTITPETTMHDTINPDDVPLDFMEPANNLPLRENTIRLSQRLYGKNRADIETYVRGILGES